MRILLLGAVLTLSAAGAFAQGCTQPFFSEYLEGTSNNKAVEIYNPSSATIDLHDYKIYRYNNGSPTPTDSLFPQDFLAAGDVWVAGNPSAIASILNESDTLHTITFFNGDDAVALVHIPSNTTLDIIGEIGVDPGTNWPVGTGATSEFTLVRQIGIHQGSTSWTQNASEYDVFPLNTDTSLGHHYMTPCCIPASAFLIGVANTNCFGDSTGAIQFTPLGTGPFTYSWINRTDTTSSISGLPAGTYTFVVTGACGSDTATASVFSPPPLIQTLSSLLAPGCNLSNGILGISVSGGTPGYTFLWSNGNTTSTMTGIPAGVYTCTVTCSNGCTSIDAYTLQNPPPPVVTVSLALDTVCAGPNGGPVSLTGETPAGGTWSGNGVNGSTFYPDSVNLGWHVITYTFTDSSNCDGVATDSIFVDFCSGISGTTPGHFDISPNPFTNEISLQFAGSSEKMISVYNMQGALVYQENVTAQSTRISLASLPAGTYFLQVIDGAEVMTQKVQKVE